VRQRSASEVSDTRIERSPLSPLRSEPYIEGIVNPMMEHMT
jgi:hypothetical protein